jgi:hypothetical protein
MRKLLALLCLVACAAVPKAEPLADCTTRCGLRVLTSAKGCLAAQALEDRELQAVADNVSVVTAKQFCASENGWVAIIHDAKPEDTAHCMGDAWWTAGMCVDGYTHSSLKIVEVADGDWAHNALAHELFHVALWGNLQSFGHCRWYEMGILKAVKQATGLTDFTRPEARCYWPDGGAD